VLRRSRASAGGCALRPQHNIPVFALWRRVCPGLSHRNHPSPPSRQPGVWLPHGSALQRLASQAGASSSGSSSSAFHTSAGELRLRLCDYDCSRPLPNLINQPSVTPNRHPTPSVQTAAPHPNKPTLQTTTAPSADYYDVLGVARSATDQEVKKAYYKLAKKYHPDTNKGDDGAAKKFQEVSKAYETLRDPEKRRLHDALVRRPGGLVGGVSWVVVGLVQLWRVVGLARHWQRAQGM
jgi:DnaJ-domain-containing protein 1